MEINEFLKVGDEKNCTEKALTKEKDKQNEFFGRPEH